ncbi:hypothetical protein ACYZTX_29135 [Pseudomonas sp. MDT1-17]
MPMIGTEQLKHALLPVKRAEAAYQQAFAAVKAAAPVDKGTALDKAKKAQHVYHGACRRLYGYVRQAVDNEEAVAALARRMGLIEGDKVSHRNNEPQGSGLMDESTPQQLFPCRNYRFCQGHLDPAQPAQGALCPKCFGRIDEGCEQVEQLVDQLAAKAQQDAAQG